MRWNLFFFKHLACMSTVLRGHLTPATIKHKLRYHLRIDWPFSVRLTRTRRKTWRRYWEWESGMVTEECALLILYNLSPLSPARWNAELWEIFFTWHPLREWYNSEYIFVVQTMRVSSENWISFLLIWVSSLFISWNSVNLRSTLSIIPRPEIIAQYFEGRGFFFAFEGFRWFTSSRSSVLKPLRSCRDSSKIGCEMSGSSAITAAWKRFQVRNNWQEPNSLF